MLKPIIQLYPVLPARDENEREALRPIGRNSDVYQSTIDGLDDVIAAADRLGIWGAATIEHHFWSEGYEVGPSPGVLNAFWAAKTKNLRVGALGYVMSTQNPIRVAEETAIIDHLSKGRFFVGFARGFQSRWTDVIGQLYGARATSSPTAPRNDIEGAGPSAEALRRAIDDDATNRAIVEENIDIVIKAWTQESIEHDGKLWKIPYPYDTGVTNWQLAHYGTTGRFGAHGELDEHNHVRRVSVVPAPYTRPHPPVLVSGSGSPDTIAYCARRGFIPVYFTPIAAAENSNRLYLKEAAAAGRHWKSGQNQCLVRWMQIGRTEEEAQRYLLEHDYDIYKNFTGAIVGRSAVRADNAVDSMIRCGLWVAGTVDSVRKQLVEQWKRCPAEYITLIYHYAQMPKERVIESMEIFMREIKPALEEVMADAQKQPVAAE